MLKQNNKFRPNGNWIAERITLLPGETYGSRFQAWKTEKISATQFCQQHPETRLVDANDSSDGVIPVYSNINTFNEDPKPIPDVFTFRMTLKCPVCRCAYALCPPKLCATTFDTFDTSNAERTKAVAICQEFAAQVNSRGNGFALFVGGTGTGKTRLACNIIGALEHKDALYVRQGELTTALRSTYGRKDIVLHRSKPTGDDDDDPPTPLEIVQGVRFLVLDEIGCGPLANDERLFLDELVKYRYDQHKPTIFVSNLALDQFKQFVGDALADRIKHAAGSGRFILQFQGESYRRSTGDDYLKGLS